MSENMMSPPEAETERLELMDLLIVLVRRKKWIAGCTLGLGAAALGISLLMTPVFTATTKIMPPQQQSSGMSAMLGQLGALAGTASTITGLKNPNDLYVAMLQSETVADRLLQRFAHTGKFKSATQTDARRRLASASIISAGKDNLISISISNPDPKLAADLANAYVEELVKLTQKLAVTDASRRRQFYEKQLQDTKDKLAQAETALKQTQEQTGMLLPEGQVQAIIGSVAQLRATIASKEVQLAAMRSFATEQNPDLLRTQQELAGLQAQLNKLQQGQGSSSDFVVPTGKIPQTGLQYVRKLRDVKYYETMFELLAKQYELARIDEARDSSTIQVLDKATVPDKRSKPNRASIVLAGILAGLITGVLGAFIRERYSKSRSKNAAKWQALRQAWSNKEA